MSKIQQTIFESFKEGISKSISSYQVLRGAIAIRTPYLGFAGEPFEIYVTEDGKVTDGGSTLSLFQSLRCYEDYLNWPPREVYFDGYCIKQVENELVCSFCSPTGILRYAQGMSALQRMFDAKPLGDEAT